MTRLIDADALKAVFEEKSSEAVCGVELCKAIISRIDEAPTVDAVPVIRCKDCIHALEYLEGKYLCYRSGGRITTAEGFCDKGEEE